LPTEVIAGSDTTEEEKKLSLEELKISSGEETLEEKRD
jgi:hypothetical protein